MGKYGVGKDATAVLHFMYKEPQEEVNKLEQELKDEIHLIIGAVTVQDAAATKEQAERATQLTVLAAVYLPLTLVTGIFGMNVWEINAGTPKFWSCIIALAVTAGLTLCFVLANRFRKKKKEAEENETKRSESAYKVA